MSFIFLRCKECGESNEIYCDGDNAMMCPECQSVDEFEEVILCEKCGHSEAKKSLFKIDLCDPCFHTDLEGLRAEQVSTNLR